VTICWNTSVGETDDVASGNMANLTITLPSEIEMTLMRHEGIPRAVDTESENDVENDAKLLLTWVKFSMRRKVTATVSRRACVVIMIGLEDGADDGVGASSNTEAWGTLWDDDGLIEEFPDVDGLIEFELEEFDGLIEREFDIVGAGVAGATFLYTATKPAEDETAQLT
jgi:hypothetical protein